MFNLIKRRILKMKEDILSQKIKGTYATDNYNKHSLVLIFLGLFNIVFGIIFTTIYYNLYEIKIPYNISDSFDVYLPSGKCYFYIQMEDFYQTNLRYSKSISHEQLKGYKDVNSKKTKPLDYIGDRDIYPAGILPNTYLQDKYSFDDLEILTDDIAWGSIKKKIKPTEYRRDEVAPPPLWNDYKEIPELYKDQRFMNWIYISPFSSFKKLWGTMEVPESGIYRLNIESVFQYGKKSVIFAQTSWCGLKNYYLSVGMIILGIACLCLNYLIRI